MVNVMDLKNIPFKTLFPETNLALNAVIKASKVILEVYNSDFSSTLKKYKEPVTEADVRSNKILIEILSKTEYPILSEESKDDKKRLNSKKMWIIDPLDGTSDFIKKSEDFSIMVGFVKDNKPIMGIVYQPINNYLYIAQENCGAYLRKDGKWLKLSVNNVNKLDICRAIISKHHLSEQEKEFLNKLNISSFTQKGSCGLKVAEICGGNTELYFTNTNKIKQWDTCAAYCLIKESGGEMTDMFGNNLKYNIKRLNHENGILVTNGVIHKEVIEKYKAFLKEQ